MILSFFPKTYIFRPTENVASLIMLMFRLGKYQIDDTIKCLDCWFYWQNLLRLSSFFCHVFGIYWWRDMQALHGFYWQRIQVCPRYWQKNQVFSLLFNIFGWFQWKFDLPYRSIIGRITYHLWFQSGLSNEKNKPTTSLRGGLIYWRV